MTISEKVMLKFDANTIDAVRKLNKLAGATNKIGEAAEKTQDRFSISLGKMTGGLLAFNQGIQAAQTLFGGLRSALDTAQFAGEFKRLEKQVNTSLVTGVQDAVGGTIDKMTIMRESVMALNAELPATEEEITSVFVAADNLAKKGFGTTEENARKMFEAIRTGEVESLKPLGFAVKEGASKLEKFDSIIGQIHEKADDGAPYVAMAENVDKLSTQLTDFATEIKVAFGEVFGEISGVIAGVIKQLERLLSFNEKTGAFTTREEMLAATDVARRVKFKYTEQGQLTNEDVIYFVNNPWATQGPSGVIINTKQYDLIVKAYKKIIKANRDKARALAAEEARKDREAILGGKGAGKPKGRGAGGAGRSRGRRGPDGGPPLYSYSGGAFDLPGYTAPSAAGAFDSTRLGDFGADSQFDVLSAGLRPGTTLQDLLGEGPQQANRDLQEASDIMAGLVTQSVQAAIMGEMNLLKAFKQAAAGRLETMAMEWYARSAGMFFFNPAGAIGLATAATAALVAAKKLGGSGGQVATPSRPSIPGGGFATGGRIGAAGGGQVTINVFGDRSPEGNAVAIDMAIKKAKLEGLIPSGEAVSRLIA